MLILKRKTDEKIRLGDDASIVILGTTGNQVKIGIDAPENVSVHREEIYQKIQADKISRLKSPPRIENDKISSIKTTTLNGIKVKIKRSFYMEKQSFP